MAVGLNVQSPPPALFTPLEAYVRDFAGMVRAGIEAYRAETGNGVTITSWWRSASRNAAVGGSPESQHQLALAVDLVPIAAAAAQAAQRVLLWRALERAGLVAIVEGDHVHAQYSPAGVWAAVIAAARARGLLG